MKQKRYWLTGAGVGFLVSIILWIAYIIYLQHFDSAAVTYLSEKTFRYIYLISVFGWRDILLMFPNLAKIEFFIFPSVSLTLYGLVIGWFIGKIKNRQLGTRMK